MTHVEAAQQTNRHLWASYEKRLAITPNAVQRVQMHTALMRKMQENLAIAKVHQQRADERARHARAAAVAAAVVETESILGDRRRAVQRSPGNQPACLALVRHALRTQPHLRDALVLPDSPSVGPGCALTAPRNSLDDAVLNVLAELPELNSIVGRAEIFDEYVNQAFEAPGPLHMAAAGCSCISARLQTYQQHRASARLLSPVEDIGVAPKLVEHCNFEPAVAELQSLATTTHPAQIAKILVNALQRSCEAAEAAGQGKMGADDLLPVLVWVIARADVKDLPIRIHLCEEFSTDASMIGEEGYAMATIATAVAHMGSLHSVGGGGGGGDGGGGGGGGDAALAADGIDDYLDAAGVSGVLEVAAGEAGSEIAMLAAVASVGAVLVESAAEAEAKPKKQQLLLLLLRLLQMLLLLRLLQTLGLLMSWLQIRKLAKMEQQATPSVEMRTPLR